MFVLPQAMATHSNCLTILAITAAVKVMQLKRVKKSLESNVAIPANLIESLNDTMSTCREMSPPLELPPGLQSQISFLIAWKPQQQK
jgi:hypothetical protein